MKKYIFIATILGFLSVGVYFLLEGRNLTPNNWTVYRNEKCGFEIWYPSDSKDAPLSSVYTSNNGLAIGDEYNGLNVQCYDSMSSIGVRGSASLAEAEKSKTLEEFLQRGGWNTQRVTLSGINGFSTESKMDLSDLVLVHFFFEKNNHIYSIDYHKNSFRTPLYEKIISSMKFF